MRLHNIYTSVTPNFVTSEIFKSSKLPFCNTI